MRKRIDYQLEEKYNELGSAHVEAINKIKQLEQEIEMLKMKWDSDNIRHCDEIESLKEQLKESVEIIKQVDNFIENHGHIDISWFPLEDDVKQFLQKLEEV